MGYANYEWFLKEDLSAYAGKWVVIIDKKIVAFGENIGKIIAEVKAKYPHKKPFVTKVNGKLSIF